MKARNVKDGTFRIDAKTACAINNIVARDEALEWAKFRSGQVSISGTEYLPPTAADLPAVFDAGQAELNLKMISIAQPVSGWQPLIGFSKN